MSRIFISHSSKNNAEAVALNGWLRDNGWDDVFLDLDQERGIKAGERWERALHEAADRCQVVVFLVSRNWLASDWCGREFDLAAKLNKRMIGVLIDDLATSDILRFTDTWQVADLAAGQDHAIFRAVIPPDDREAHVTFSQKGLVCLKAGLQAAGLDPRFFAWPPADDPNRPPYRGLAPVEEADAGIFFGREADIVRALDELRGLARKAPPRIFVIEGASGCGKSSFLRAGLIPRLKRDDRNYLVLPPIRPEQAAIDGARGFVSALEVAFHAAGLPRNRADLRALATSPEKLEAALVELSERTPLTAMPGEAEAAPPAIVIPVDQAEELFQSGGREPGRRLLALLARLALSKALRVLLVFTIRTDDYEPLQTAAALEGMAQHIFGLAPIPIGRLGTIIEGPARHLSESGRTLTIEPALVARLLKDLQEGAAADVMPLCAFILERLWRECGGDGKLQLAEYECAERGIGGIRGAIESAVAAAFNEPERDPGIPLDRAEREALLRRAMIPALAAIDPETRTPRRRVARLSEIPPEARPLIERLVAAQLLSTDRDPETKERTVEPAHEALLRQWSLMETWLDEDARELLVLEGVERAAIDWDKNGRAPGPGWLVHAGGRLEDAERLRGRPDFEPRLSGATGDYLDGCRTTEIARRDKDLADARRIAVEQEARAAADRRARDRTRIGLAASIVLLVAAAIAAVLAWKTNNDLLAANEEAVAQRDAATDQMRIARNNEAAALAALSSVALNDGRPVEAAKLALASWPRTPEDPLERRSVALRALGAVTAELRERIRLQGTGNVLSVAFSPDGTRIASGSSDRVPRIWDAATGAELVSFKWHANDVTSVAFSPDGTRLATGSSDGTARIWDAATGKVIVRIEFYSRGVMSVAFSPDGARLATGSGEGTVLIWDATTGMELARLEGHENRINSVAFSPDGARLASGSNDGTVRIWDVAKRSEIARIGGHSGGAKSVAFSPDGAHLATGWGEGTVLIWNADTVAEIARIEAHGDRVTSVAFSPDGARLATGSWDHTARIWDITTSDEILRIESHAHGVLSVSFSPDGSRLATGSWDRTARIWDIALGLEIGRLEGHKHRVTSTKFSPAGSRLATGSRDRTAIIWNAFAWTKIARLEGHSDGIEGVAFSPGGMRIATASDDGTARVWDAATGEEIARFEGPRGTLSSVAFSPDGAKVAAGSADHTAWIWNVATPAEVARFRGHEFGTTSVAFSPDGIYLATGGGDRMVRIWDIATMEEIVRLEGHSRSVSSVAFSPDGTYLASGSDDGTARVWDVTREAEIARLEGHRSAVTSVAFSSGGARLATGSNDGIALIWDVATGTEIARLKGHKDRVTSVAFSPDGIYLATGSWDRQVQIWRITFAPYDHDLRLGIPPGDIFRIACTWLPWVNGEPDFSLTDIADAYGIQIDEPICNYDSGYDPPFPAIVGD